MNVATVQQYLSETSPVEGWFFPVDAQLFAFIDHVQQERSLTGNLYEIGVHHGKTALLLARFLRPGERLGVCDVFGNQDLNLDRSGEGSLRLFLRNVGTYTSLDPSAVAVHPKRSDALTEVETTTGCRIFHIDGGHLPKDVKNDLQVAIRALHRDGVVIVDDVFNSSWPGVAEGFFEFLRSDHTELVPLLIGGNKVFLCRPGSLGMYEEAFADLGSIAAVLPFTFERKRWLGRDVMTAVRHHWVDLDPAGAAIAHASPPAWKRRILGWLHR